MLIAAGSSLVAPNELWGAWSAEPGVVASLVVGAIAYGSAAFNARRRSRRALSWRAIASFAAGWLALLVALVSPLDRLSDTLFAAHMAQHLILIVIAAPLVVLGAPPAIWLWALPAEQRRAIGRFSVNSRVVRGLRVALTNPTAVLVAQTAALWFWHFPKPYQAALEHSGIHLLEHVSFFGTAALFWWVTLHPSGRRSLGFGASILFVAITLCQSGALGALLMFSARPWYSVHAAGEALWGITPLADQQIAGLIMWIPAGVVYIAAAAVLFMQWMAADERATRITERVSAPVVIGDAI